MPEIIEKNLSKISVIVGIIVVVCSVFTVINGYSEYQNQVNSYVSDIESLHTSIDTVVGQSSEDLDEGIVLNSVKSVGDKVSVLQNSYRNLMISDTVDKASVDDVTKDMSVYFKDTDICKSWYDCSSSYIQKGTWRFATTYDFVGNDVSVLWQFVDVNKHVLAYVTADYHVDTKMFDNVLIHNTILGDAYMNYVNDETTSDFNADSYLSKCSVFEKLGMKVGE